MFRPMITRTLALAVALALLSPGVAHSQCVITGDSSLCNGPVQLCGPDGIYEYMWIDPAGNFTFDRCVTASVPGVYMLRITDQFGTSYGPCSKTVGETPPPPCAISGPTSGCEGSTVELCGPQGEYRYTWSGPGGFASTAQCVQVGVGGTYRLSVWRTSDNCPEAMCEHTVAFSPCEPPPPPPPPPPAVDNCPRPAWFWLKQCVASQRSEGRLDPAQFDQVAAAVDAAVGMFSWPNAREGFCATLHGRPLSLRSCAKRQFATMHANVCAGEMDLPAVSGRVIKLDRSTRIEMYDVNTTVGEWLAATEARLVHLQSLSSLTRDARNEYRRIVRVAWHINHGRGIGPVCGRRAIDSDRAEPVAGLSDRGELAAGFVDDPEDPLAEQLAAELDEMPARAVANPNPFSAMTTVTYVVGGSATQQAAIAVYDLAGRKVRDLLRGPQSPGVHELRWDGRGDDGAPVRSGVYLVRGLIGSQRVAGQLTVLR